MYRCATCIPIVQDYKRTYTKQMTSPGGQYGGRSYPVDLVCRTTSSPRQIDGYVQ